MCDKFVLCTNQFFLAYLLVGFAELAHFRTRALKWLRAQDKIRRLLEYTAYHLHFGGYRFERSEDLSGLLRLDS